MSKNRKERLKRKADREEWKEAKRIESIRSRLLLTDIGMERRECGECQACCEVIAINGDENCSPSDNYERCQHQCSSGCGIYSKRPEECRTYECLWQRGMLTSEEMRPDKLGVLLDRRMTGIGEKGSRPREVIAIWETRPGALNEEAVKTLIKWIKVNTRVLMMVIKYGDALKDENGFVKKKLL
jgi:Fe-S-cluster containining protein